MGDGERKSAKKEPPIHTLMLVAGPLDSQSVFWMI
jgi:hypothetical protein